jgi:hypothetical protein
LGWETNLFFVEKGLIFWGLFSFVKIDPLEENMSSNGYVLPTSLSPTGDRSCRGPFGSANAGIDSVGEGMWRASFSPTQNPAPAEHADRALAVTLG